MARRVEVMNLAEWGALKPCNVGEGRYSVAVEGGERVEVEAVLYDVGAKVFWELASARTRPAAERPKPAPKRRTR